MGITLFVIAVILLISVNLSYIVIRDGLRDLYPYVIAISVTALLLCIALIMFYML